MIVETQHFRLGVTGRPSQTALALVALLWLWLTGIFLPNLPAADSTSVSFTRDLAPILAQKCIACHNTEKSKGGYQLHTFERLLQPGDSKEPPVVAGLPKQSKLFHLIIAADDDDRMPQKDDPLPAPQIALIQRWISEGAKYDGGDPATSLAVLVASADHPAPPSIYARPVPILALAFNPNGSVLAASGYYEVTLWNPTNGHLLGRLTNAPQRVHALAYSPDGASLAVAGGTPGRSGEVRLFDAASGRVQAVFGVARDAVLATCFSPDGRQLSVAGADNTIRNFDFPSGRQRFAAEVHGDWVLSLAFNPEGTQLASASRDKTVRLLDAKTGEVEFTYAGHQGPVFAVAFSPDGTNLCTGGRDREIHVWRASDGKKTNEIAGFDGDIHRLLWDGETIFSCSADSKVRILPALEKKSEARRTLSGHNASVYALAIDLLRDRLAAGSFDGTVKIWSATDGSLLHSFTAAPGLKPVAASVKK